jgi:hypothetical protein
MISRLKEQLDAVRQEMSDWPTWRKMEIEAEVAKTPERRKPGQHEGSDQKSMNAPGRDRSTTK